MSIVEKTDAFLQKYNGKRVDIDSGFPKGNPYQCWDLAGLYAREVVGCPTFPTRVGGNGGAVDCFRIFLQPLPQYFKRYVYGSVTPQKGDLIFWNENQGNGDGHVSIFIGSVDNNQFYSFDQNWPIGTAPHVQLHNWIGVLGIFRPIVNKEGADMTTAQAAKLALFIRLLGFETVDSANNQSADDVAHIVADPAYAAAMAEQIKNGQWQLPAWKSAHYDETLAKLQLATEQLRNQPTKDNLENLQKVIDQCTADAKAQSDKAKADTEAGESFLRRVGQFVKRFLP